MRPRKSPAWTRQQRQARWEWCLKRQQMSVENWGEVVFSDEINIELGQRKSQYVRKSSGEKIRPGHCVQHRPMNRKLLIWGCITTEGPGLISIMSGTMDSMLTNHILPFKESIPTFQMNGVSMRDWPARFPDVRP